MQLLLFPNDGADVPQKLQHVSPYMLRLIKKIKGDDRIILISDAFVDHGPIPAGDLYEGADDINFDFSGEIAGSKMILDAPAAT